jgi:hypothetical protein
MLAGSRPQRVDDGNATGSQIEGLGHTPLSMADVSGELHALLRR